MREKVRNNGRRCRHVFTVLPRPTLRPSAQHKLVLVPGLRSAEKPLQEKE